MTNTKKKTQQSKYNTRSYNIATRIFRDYVKEEIKTIPVILILLLISAATTAVNAWLMQPVLDDVFMERKSEMLLWIPIAVVINSLVKGFAEFHQNASIKIFGNKMVLKMQKRLYEHLLYSDIKLFHDNASGKLISKFTNEINAIKRSISDFCTGSVRDAVTLVALLSLMLYQSGWLSLIFLGIFPLVFLPILKLGKRLRRTAKKMQEGLASFSVVLDETFRNIITIKSYCGEKYELARANKTLKEVESSYRKSAYIESTPSPLMEFVGGIAIALAIWYGGRCVINNLLTPGEFFSFITALLLCYKPLKGILELNTKIQEGLSAAHRLFDLIDAKPLVNERAAAAYVKLNKYDIVFDNVSFSYGRSRRRVLNHFNIEIESGQTVALVGTSGVGKSTILQLLQRFYDPNGGEILIGGQRIADMKLDQLRSSIAFVSQDISIFDETIGYNIKYGKMNASEEDVIQAAKAAAAHEFILEMSEGYNTPVGQSGLRLSGGQKQRISIARAILKNAPILLLDEATSALDAISEGKVQQALNNLKKGHTTIIIAHRLSTIENADVVFFMGDGGTPEFGTHKELLNKNKRYSKLYSHYKNSSNIIA